MSSQSIGLDQTSIEQKSSVKEGESAAGKLRGRSVSRGVEEDQIDLSLLLPPNIALFPIPCFVDSQNLSYLTYGVTPAAQQLKMLYNIEVGFQRVCERFVRSMRRVQNRWQAERRRHLADDVKADAVRAKENRSQRLRADFRLGYTQVDLVDMKDGRVATVRREFKPSNINRASA